MKRLVLVLSVSAAILGGFIAYQASSRSAPPAPAADPLRDDLRATLGVVPAFFDAHPAAGRAAWWEELKALQLGETALSGEVKELIGLAVAAQIPCEYCIYFHERAADLNGASARERQEAVAMAATSRHWSTVLNGSAVPFEEFEREVEQILSYVSAGASKPGPVASITDATTAHADITRTLGLVPSFLAKFPDVAIAPAWKQLRAVQLNPETELSGKNKELIGLAVSSQIPCRYCVLFHTEAARAQGATDAEIEEAIAMAAVTRFGSTVLNGNRVDMEQFRKDVDAIIENARRNAAGK